MKQIKAEQYKKTMESVLVNTGKKIMAVGNKKSIDQYFKGIYSNPFSSSKLPNNFLSNLTAPEIKDIINKTMIENNIDIPKYEFSVTCNLSINQILRNPEIHSTNYYTYSNNNSVPIYTTAIYTESGSDEESIVGNGSLTIIITNSKTTLFKGLELMILVAIIFTSIIIAAFYLTVSTLLKQKKISEIKSDFINNMTHEFKTPLATISLAVDALKNEKVVGNVEKTNYFTSIIKDENKRMNKQVESILQAALLDKDELQLNLKPLNLNSIIENSFSQFKILLDEKSGIAKVNLNAKKDGLLGDEVHINNLIRNLMDNAIKYSKPNIPPNLIISTVNIKNNIAFIIEDNGIGMAKETVSRIFEKFYRAHTGNVHNVKGFGLGLTYVKAIVNAHKANIKVDSTLGKGTIFTVEFPCLDSTN